MSERKDRRSVSGNGDQLEDEPKGIEESAESAQANEPAVDDLRREMAELKEQLLRRRADFENYRKRVERDRETAQHEKAAEIFSELVPTIDNLERALVVGGEEATLRSGVEMILRELLAVFDRHGVKTEDPTGRLFDPTVHQALSHETVPGLPEGTVAEAFRKGYSYRDRLLRPALVKVAKGESTDDDQQTAEEETAREEKES